MSAALLTKGFEVEMYTGRPDGTVVGCAAEAAAALEGFVTEPDQRNLEYITPPMPAPAASCSCCSNPASGCAAGWPPAA